MNQGKNEIDVIQESVESNVYFIENLRIDDEIDCYMNYDVTCITGILIY